MTNPDRSLIERYYAAWQPDNAERLLEYFSPNAVFEDFAFRARFEGPLQIRSFIDLTYAGIPDFRVTPVEIIVAENAAAARWVMSGTHDGDLPGLPATGKTFEVPASSVITLDGELISGMYDYWNPDAFRQCVGLS